MNYLVKYNDIVDNLFSSRLFDPWNIVSTAFTGITGFTQGFPIDMYSSDKDITLKIYLPGVEKENIKVTIKDNLLVITICSQYESTNEKNKESFNQHCYFGYVLKEENISCNYKNGVLSIVVTKTKNDDSESKTKSIKIN